MGRLSEEGEPVVTPSTDPGLLLGKVTCSVRVSCIEISFKKEWLADSIRLFAEPYSNLDSPWLTWIGPLSWQAKPTV